MQKISTITSKRQLTIPSQIFQAVGLKEGQKVLIEDKDGAVIVKPASDVVDRLAGSVKVPARFVALGIEEMQDAMRAKKVDAVSAWDCPLTQISRQLGPDGVIFYDREIYTETFNIAARQDFVHKNPEVVKRFLRALIKAEDFVVKNPDAAQSIMSAGTNIDVGLIREVWDAFNYHVVLDQTLLITLEDEARWAMKNKLTDRTDMPDYLSFIHFDSLREVKPEAIKMTR